MGAVEKGDERAGIDEVLAFALAAGEAERNLGDIATKRMNAGVNPDALLIGADEDGADAGIVVGARPLLEEGRFFFGPGPDVLKMFKEF